MTISPRPMPPDHLDEAAVRGELTRVFDICRDCRRCVDRCVTFPTLFDRIGSTGSDEAGMLTPADQDAVVDTCHGCGACRTDCPYAPGLHPAGVDIPTLMVRAVAMRRANGQQSRRDRRAAFWLSSAPRSIATVTSGRSVLTRLVSTLTGLSAARRAGRPAATRLSVWSARRPAGVGAEPSPVTIVPTCLVEFQRPDVGRDLIGLHERAGVACDVASFRCCGAPSYQAGDLRRFRRAASRMVAALDDRAVAGAAIVVPEATCADVIRRRYPEVLSGPALDRVLAAVTGPVEHLGRIGIGRAADDPVRPIGPVPERVVHSAAPAGRHDAESAAVVDLLAAVGCAVTVTEHGIGGAGPWGLRAANDATAADAMAALLSTATNSGATVITCGDVRVPLVGDDTRTPPVLHPIEILARAVGADPG